MAPGSVVSTESLYFYQASEILGCRVRSMSELVACFQQSSDDVERMADDINELNKLGQYEIESLIVIYAATAAVHLNAKLLVHLSRCLSNETIKRLIQLIVEI